MDDQEMIFHLKKEIDNLRNQVREANGGSLNPPSSQSSSAQATGMASYSFPILSLVLLLAVVVVARWRKRGYQYSGISRSSEMTMTFELQDAHDYALPERKTESLYAAPSADVHFV